jgi:hypothetical protein
MKTVIYISLIVYNYGRSPRHHRIKHICQNVEHARHLMKRLQTLNTDNGLPCRGESGHTGRWLERNHGIYGFVDTIEGIFEETTRKVEVDAILNQG